MNAWVSSEAWDLEMGYVGIAGVRAICPWPATASPAWLDVIAFQKRLKEGD